MRKLVLALAALTLVITVAGCTGSGTAPTPSGPRPTRVRTPTSVPANDKEAIEQLINAEGEAVVQQDIDRLQAMWASDGVVTDANHAPNNPSGFKTWSKWGAIRDRYVNIVFPSGPGSAQHPNIKLTITGDTASAIADTIIGSTNAKDNDKWTFRKIDGQWKITSLTFSLAPQ